MNKSLYTKIVKDIAKWTDVEAEQIDTADFRYPKNLQYTFATKDWELIVDYNQSDYKHGDDHQKLLPVSDRSISFYYSDTSRGYTLSKSIFIFKCDGTFVKPMYTHIANVNTKVNNDHVASYHKDIDLFDDDGKYMSNFADVICHLILYP